MKLKISFTLIGLACTILVTTAIKLGSLNGTELIVASATMCVFLIAGFYLLDESGSKKDPIS